MDDTNQVVMEPSAGTEGATASEPAPAAEVSQEAPDWYKHLDNASDDEISKFLDEHPKAKPLIERKAQSHADRVLLKSKERILADAKVEADRVAQQQAWGQQWAGMSRQQRADWLLQSHEAQEQLGKTIGGWWNEQSQAVKNLVPEFKDRPIEEWNALIEKHPASFGELMAAAINEAVETRLKTELPKRLKDGVEAALKNKTASNLAGQVPDLNKGSNGGRLKDISTMSTNEWLENKDDLYASAPPLGSFGRR